MIIHLNVPYAEKDQAKALGARWNPSRKTWYIEDKEDLTPFLQWIPEPLLRPRRRTSSLFDNRSIRNPRPRTASGQYYNGETPPWE